MATSLLLASTLASAQWVWKEGDRRVFSDTPPPASVPEQNIVKRPGGQAPMLAPPAMASEETSAAVANAPQLPTVDKALEARKKQTEQADEARKKADDQRLAANRAESCARARQGKATMDSGVRVATTNAKGEREIMDDKTRAAEVQRLDGIIRSDCGPMPARAAAAAQ